MGTEVLVLARLLALALALTVAIELCAAVLVFGLRERRELAVVALAQVVTNPTVELVCLWVGWNPHLPLASNPWMVMLVAEAAALVVEALLYHVAEVGEHPWLMSAALNVLSFGLGIAWSLLT